MNLFYSISNDSGFVALVNAEKYKSFINEDWEFEQLIQRFTDEMNTQNMILWNTGFADMVRVVITDKEKTTRFFREFNHTIIVTNEELYLTNYDDLSMAAQYCDEKLPSKHNSDLIIPLKNGCYLITVRQLNDPEDYDYEDDKIHFEIIVEKHENVTQTSVITIPWLDAE
jgi:hypothetical protein